MIRSALGKVAWVGRTASMVFGLALVLALIFGVATMALGANGNPFLLGKQNAATKVSTLIKRGVGPALGLQVKPGQPPMRVNSSGKVTNLNADQLDGKSEADFYAAGSKVADSAHADTADTATDAQNADTLDDKDSADFLSKTEKAADADMLDGQDSGSFANGVGGVATDADKLDGKSSEQFASAAHKHSGTDINSGQVAESHIDNSIARDSEITTGFGMQSTAGSLFLLEDTKILGSVFTPSASGKCLVTVSTQITSPDGDNTGLGPSYRIAIKRGDTAPFGDDAFGHYILPTSQAGTSHRSHSVTRSAVVNVTGGEATQFGAYFSGVDGAWAGDRADVHITYWCTTVSGPS